MIDVRLDRYSAAERKPLTVKNDEGEIVDGHLADFHKAILAKGATTKHAGMVESRAAKIIDLCGAKRISDLTPSAVHGDSVSAR